MRVAGRARDREAPVPLGHVGRRPDRRRRGRDGGDLDRTRRLGLARFERAVRAEVARRGGVRPCLRIVRRLFAALDDKAGVVAHRPAVFERLEWTLADWDEARAKLADVEARMTAVLDELGLTALVTSIDGLSPVGAAAILAQTGDLTRFTSARAVVKHAGLAPRERKSGTFTGKARVTGAGRPQLRVAAWRAVWGCLQTNRVYAARYRHLTSRETQPADPDPGADRGRRSDPAPAVRRRHPAAGVGPGHRRPRHHRVEGDHEHHCGITTSGPTRAVHQQEALASMSWGGVSLPRH